MDLEQALAKIAELEGKISELDGNNTKLNTELTETKERLRQRGEEFKRLRDMTEEEKKKLSDAELQILKNQEKLENDQKAFQEQQAKFFESQRNAMIDKYVNDHAKGNKELADKIRFNFDNTLKAVEANDDASIAKKVTSALALVKQEAPDLVNTAINEGGRADDSNLNGNGFADTEAGKSLAQAMGLNLGKSNEGNDKK